MLQIANFLFHITDFSFQLAEFFVVSYDYFVSIIMERAFIYKVFFRSIVFCFYNILLMC